MALQHLVIGGYPNPVRANLTEITAGSVGATMTEANLKTIEPSEPLRIDSVFPHESYVDIDFQISTSVQLLAQVSDSLVPGDQLRVVGVESGSLPVVRSVSILPSSVEDEDSRTDTTDPLDLDEHPSTPDGIKTTFFTTGSYMRIRFANPASQPALGTHLQCFILWVNATQDPVDPDDYPWLEFQLWQNGVFVKNLGAKAVSSSSGLLMIVPWTVNDLPNTAATTVEILITHTELAGFCVAQMDCLRWECLYQTAVDSADYDSGWITRQGQSPDPTWGNTTIEQTDQINSQWTKLLSTTLHLERIRLEYRVDGLGFFDNLQITEPRDPATFIDIGIIIASAIFDAPYRFAPGGNISWEHMPVGGDSISGSNRQVTQWLRRVARIILEVLPNSIAHRVFARLDRNGPNHPIFVMLDPSSTDDLILSNTSFYTVITESQGLTFLGDGMADGERTKSLGYTFTERL